MGLDSSNRGGNGASEAKTNFRHSKKHSTNNNNKNFKF